MVVIWFFLGWMKMVKLNDNLSALLNQSNGIQLPEGREISIYQILPQVMQLLKDHLYLRKEIIIIFCFVGLLLPWRKKRL